MKISKDFKKGFYATSGIICCLIFLVVAALVELDRKEDKSYVNARV